MRTQLVLTALVASLVALSIGATGAAAAAPVVTLTPTSLTFAAQAIGTTSAAQSVTVANTGAAGLFINSARVPNTLDFTVVGDSCSGMTLAPGTSCRMSITFAPTATGTRSAALTITDNAANSPQTVPITGGGTGTNPALAINTQFYSCTSGVCDIGASSNVFVNNFYSNTFQASGGTSPYTWSGNPPSGLTLRPSGLLFGTPTTLGTSTFAVTVTDATGAKATGTFSLTVTNSPAPSPSGCQTGPNAKMSLSGPTFNGKTPRGEAQVDESQFSACGGFSILSVQVSDVNLPDGAQLWVAFDYMPVGIITLRGGSGSMPSYNLGRFGTSRDQVQVASALPDVPNVQQILIGGTFVQ